MNPTDRDSITQAVVLITAHGRLSAHRDQPIGGIIDVCIHAIRKQIAIRIEGVTHAIDARQPIGGIIDIVLRGKLRRFR